MLKELNIVNLALIEELRISFPEGLIVLTGETGAGKSIILQAIHLLSGGKASANWIRTGADSASVEALFEIPVRQQNLIKALQDKGIDTDGEVAIRRVLSGGTSRFYINGGLATAKIAGEIAENLLSVASQHDHQQLLAPRSHLDFIDSLGGHWPDRQQLGRSYEHWQDLRTRYRRLQDQEKEKEQRRDFLAFQVKEIEDAGLDDPAEDENLTREKERLKSSDTLIRLGRESYQLLHGAVLDNLTQVRKNLEQMAAFDQAVTNLSEKVAGHAYELEDHVARLRDYIESVPSDPAQLDQVTARIDLLQRLKRKYGISLTEVIEYGEKARQELEELDAMDQRLAELEAQVQQAEQELCARAQALSKARQQTAIRLTEVIGAAIKSLCLEQARFEIRFAPSEEAGLAKVTRSGWDRPEFMFSANPGEPLKPLAKVASGGELSRLMLALKCVLAQEDQVETVIFDEVDAGISGKAAEAVARKIKELAGHHQVLCITHLPQIASFANEHYRVLKTVADERTRTTITHLSQESKVAELARMLDGDSVSPQTLAYVKELLARNQKLTEPASRPTL